MGVHDVKALLQKHGFHTKKQLGQNFLVDTRVLEQIASATGADASTVALEVGPGAGALTTLLARHARHVVAIEKDTTLEPVLRDVLSPFNNVTIEFEDCLEADIEALLEPYIQEGDQLVFAANLPYYITTPILFRILESALPLTRAVVMVQKEVADRMIAKPGSKDYGVLSVGVQYRALPERLLTVPPSAFLPQPGVDSAVVLLDCQKREYAVQVADEKRFFQVVRAAFSTRRKTLLNALSNGCGMSKEVCKSWLLEAGISPELRAERLTIEQFADLANLYPSV